MNAKLMLVTVLIGSLAGNFQLGRWLNQEREGKEYSETQRKRLIIELDESEARRGRYVQYAEGLTLNSANEKSRLESEVKRAQKTIEAMEMQIGGLEGMLKDKGIDVHDTRPLPTAEERIADSLESIDRRLLRESFR